MQALHDAELFRSLAPVELGGFGLTIPEGIAVIERVAEQDASTGGCSPSFPAVRSSRRSFAPEAFASVYGPKLGLAAGSLNPVATRAEAVDGGYRFTGRATYLSGSAHAKWMMAAAIVTSGGEPLVADGGIEIRVGLIPIDQARSLDTWHVTGMRATGSTDYEFDDVMVETGCTFEPFRAASGGPG